MSRIFTRRAASRAPVLVILFLFIVGGAMAYRFFFKRPGEQAIQLIPGDAYIVVTLDTNPSPAQTPVFKRIHDAMEQEGLNKKLEDSVSDVVEKSPIVKEVRPYTSSSYAVAVLNKGTGKDAFDAQPVIFVALNDPGKVTDYLAKYGTKQTTDGLTYYKFAKDNTCAEIISNYLVLAQPSELARIDSVQKGQTASVASLPEYQAARASLPTDANLMVFFSPAAIKSIGNQAKSLGVNPLRNTDWMAFSATVRDQGIAIDYRCPMDQNRDAMLKTMAGIGPLDFSIFQKLPAGAYGVVGMSQPGKYWDAMTQEVKQVPDSAKGFDDGVAEFEKQTGMSVPRDIIPALQGHMWLAAYPDVNGADKGVDGIIVIDDANGASPDALAEKVRAFIEKTSAKEGSKGVHFQSVQKSGATCWSMDEASTQEMRKSLTDMADSRMGRRSHSEIGGPVSIQPAPGSGSIPQSFTPDVQLNVDPNHAKLDVPGAHLNADGSAGSVNLQAPGVTAHVDSDRLNVQAPGTSVNVTGTGADVNAGGRQASIGVADPANSAGKYLQDKAMVYAQVGHTVIIASSQAMLDKAVGTYTGVGGATLAQDQAFSGMKSVLPAGSQSACMVNLSGIMQAFKPQIEKAIKDADMGIKADDIINLFGQSSSGLVIGGHYDGKVSTGTFFLPLSYEHMIHLIGSGMHSMEGPKNRPGLTSLRNVPHVVRMLANPVALLVRRDAKRLEVATR
jgi:hypothetical protein